MQANIRDFQWTREPERYTLTDDRVEVVTKPHTDLWQRTYYHFRNDNAPVVRFFIDDADTVTYGQHFLKIICITCPAISVTMMIISIFQATGQKTKPMLLSLLRKGGIGRTVHVFDECPGRCRRHPLGDTHC